MPGQMKGDFPALVAAWLCGSAAVWSLIARQEGGWEGSRRKRRRRVGVGCSDAEVQSSSQPGYGGGGYGQAAAVYSG